MRIDFTDELKKNGIVHSSLWKAKCEMHNHYRSSIYIDLLLYFLNTVLIIYFKYLFNMFNLLFRISEVVKMKKIKKEQRLFPLSHSARRKEEVEKRRKLIANM